MAERRRFGSDPSVSNRRTQGSVSQHSEDAGSSMQDNDGVLFDGRLHVGGPPENISFFSGSVRSGDGLVENSSSRSGGTRTLSNRLIGSRNNSVLSRGESLQQSELTVGSSSRQTVPSQSGSLFVSEGQFNEDLLERMPNNQIMLKIVVLGGPETGKATFARNFVAETDLGVDEDEANGSTGREHFERYAAFENAAVEIWVGPSIHSDAEDIYISKIMEDIGDWHKNHVLFVILSKDDVNETDDFLAKHLTDFGKRFFFVRSHFDEVFQQIGQMDDGEQPDESLKYDAQEQVKMGIRERLEKTGIESNGFEVFVINCKRLADWDFRVLKRRLCEEAEVDCLKQKAAAFKNRHRQTENTALRTTENTALGTTENTALGTTENTVALTDSKDSDEEADTALGTYIDASQRVINVLFDKMKKDFFKNA